MRIWPQARSAGIELSDPAPDSLADPADQPALSREDRKSTRLNSSHSQISYAVFCLKKKKMLFPELAEEPPGLADAKNGTEELKPGKVPVNDRRLVTHRQQLTLDRPRVPDLAVSCR